MSDMISIEHGGIVKDSCSFERGHKGARRYKKKNMYQKDTRSIKAKMSYKMYPRIKRMKNQNIARNTAMSNKNKRIRYII